MMRRREFIAALGVRQWRGRSPRAQQPALPLIGVMSPLSVATAARNLAANNPFDLVRKRR